MFNKKQILVSAGDAITAKLVQEAGFDGIWISGFEASARLGLADNGSITMTEMLNIAKPIVDAVNIPVWVDTDTGYGNFSRTLKEFEKIGVYGVCIEDNLPKKQNSLWGDKIPLMDKREFGEKLLLSHVNRKIKIIARTEALIRGYGKVEAIDRLLYYKECGADILLPHTRDQQQLIDMDLGGHPKAIVPTKFPSFTSEKLHSMGYSMIIWANQTERVKIKATRECLGSLMGSDCAEYIEANLSATLEDLKGLTASE